MIVSCVWGLRGGYEVDQFVFDNYIRSEPPVYLNRSDIRSQEDLEETAEQGRQCALGVHDTPPAVRTSRAKAWNRALACSSKAVVIRK